MFGVPHEMMSGLVICYNTYYKSNDFRMPRRPLLSGQVGRLSHLKSLTLWL